MDQQEFNTQMLTSIEVAITGAMNLRARIVNLGELSVRDTQTGKDQLIKITIVAEPQVFGKTIYSTDADVKSVGGTISPSSVIDQLKQFENIQ